MKTTFLMEETGTFFIEKKTGRCMFTSARKKKNTSCMIVRVIDNLLKKNFFTLLPLSVRFGIMI